MDVKKLEAVKKLLLKGLIYKDLSKELSKEFSKEFSKELSKELSKEPSKEPSKELSNSMIHKIDKVEHGLDPYDFKIYLYIGKIQIGMNIEELFKTELRSVTIVHEEKEGGVYISSKRFIPRDEYEQLSLLLFNLPSAILKELKSVFN